MKIALLKLSGKTLTDFLSTNKWITAIQNLYKEFDGIIVVHGAGKDISEWSTKLGLKNEFLNGQRVTTSEQMNVVAAVQAGVANTKIVAKLVASNIEAVGHSGIDRGTFVAKYLNKDLGYVGKPELVGSTKWITSLLVKKVIPVFSSVCIDVEGNLMNVNADIFAEVMALSLNADTVFFASDIDGVIINGEVKDSLTEEEIINGIVGGEITDGMIPKLNSCMELLKKGINKIWIGSRLDNNNLKNNEVKNGNGTWIVTSNKNEYELLRTA
jgi:acetylglutamate kinase